jgi:hypothetical protein
MRFGIRDVERTDMATIRIGKRVVLNDGSAIMDDGEIARPRGQHERPNMIARIFIVLLGTMSLIGPSAADDGRRFPDEHITVEDWNTYFAEVKTLPDVTINESDQQTTIIRQNPSLVIYSFTTPSNPAHPGIVIRQLVMTKDGYGMHRTGYYAGSREAFARWWSAFGSLDAKIKAQIASIPSPGQTETPDVEVRKNADGTFNLTLVSHTISNVNDAQMALRAKALEVCEGRRPKLGVYRFDKVEKVAGPSSKSGDLVTFKLDQEIICE